MNLRDERGRALVRRLIETSDVVIENYSARVMANFGLTYETLRSWKRDIIMVSMPGFGASGPWRDYVAFGQTVEAVSGLTHFNGYPGEDPRLLSNGADPFVGINGMVATLLALVHRQRTGEGQRVEVAQMEAITPFIGADLLRFQMDGSVRPRIRQSARVDVAARLLLRQGRRHVGRDRGRIRRTVGRVLPRNRAFRLGCGSPLPGTRRPARAS